MGEILLSAEELTVEYNGKEVIHKINAEFESGKITAVIGPNGSGKSTLLKALIGLVPIKEGKVFSENVPAERLTSIQKARRIAYLPQMKNIPDLTVKTMVLHGRFSHLSYPRKYRKEDMDAVENALRITGLSEVSEMNVSRLSGGTAQRVFIAMALAQNSPVILMDEPTSFLDISHQIRIMELCRALAAEGKAIVTVIHDLPAALKYSDKIIVIADGEVKGKGTSNEVYVSGILNEIFGVDFKQTEGKKGKAYYIE